MLLLHLARRRRREGCRDGKRTRSREYLFGVVHSSSCCFLVIVFVVDVSARAFSKRPMTPWIPSAVRNPTVSHPHPAPIRVLPEPAVILVQLPCCVAATAAVVFFTCVSCFVKHPMCGNPVHIGIGQSEDAICFASRRILHWASRRKDAIQISNGFATRFARTHPAFEHLELTPHTPLDSYELGLFLRAPSGSHEPIFVVRMPHASTTTTPGAHVYLDLSGRVRFP